MTAAAAKQANPEPTGLWWVKLNEWTAESDKGGYRVTKSGPPEDTRYTLWREGPWYAFNHEPIAYSSNKQEITRLAVEDYLSQQRKGANQCPTK